VLDLDEDARLLEPQAVGGGEDVDAAVRSARKAFESGAWSRMSPLNRKKVLLKFADLLEANGIPCKIRSAGGIATWNWTAAYPGLTEIQAGTYVVMDNFHGRMVPGFEHSLTIQATVISRQSDKVIVDAGNKSVADPADVTVAGHDLKVLRFDEEHGIFSAPEGSSLRVGDAVALVPGYSPSTVNWYDAYHIVRDEVIVDIWPIIPRGPGHHGLAR